MIRVIYNPNRPELIFSIASIFMSEPNQFIAFLPVVTKDLLKYGPNELSIVPIAEHFKEISGTSIVDECDQTENIILLGIGPKNNSENSTIINFFDQYKTLIKFWIDDQIWDASLIKYLEPKSNQVIINKDSTCLNILKDLGQAAPGCWLKPERAMKEQDQRNPLAARYLRAAHANLITSKNYMNSEDSHVFFFHGAMQELVTTVEDPAISFLEDSFLDMKDINKKAKKSITSNLHFFKKAKKTGRPIGYLKINDMSDLVDVEEIINYGSNRYPWMFIFEYSFNQTNHLICRSKIISKTTIDSLLDECKIYSLDAEDRLAFLAGSVTSFEV